MDSPNTVHFIKRNALGEPKVEVACAKLQSSPDDAESLRTLGEWYAFRGENAWAGELLEKSRACGQKLPRSRLRIVTGGLAT